MSAASNCDCPCPTISVTEVPGSQGATGAAGADGTDGINAFTTTSDPLTVPLQGANVIIDVGETGWVAEQQILFISDGTSHGFFEVNSALSSTQLNLTFLGYFGDSPPTTIISAGAVVSPAGIQPPLAAALPNDITDNSTGTPSDTIATLINQRFVTMSFPILLTSTDTPADLVTDLVLPFKGAVISWQFVTEVVATSGGTADVNVELQLGATAVTGSATNLSQAAFAAIGQVKAGGIITALNTFNSGATFSIVCTSSAVNFTAGKINAYVTFAVREDALNDAIASLAAHIDALVAALTYP